MSVVELLALSGQVQPGQRLGHPYSIALGHKRRVSLRSPTSGQSEGSSCVNTRVHVVREREIAGTRELTEEFESVRDAIDWMAHTRGEAVFLVSPETGRVLTFAGLREKSLAISTRLSASRARPRRQSRLPYGQWAVHGTIVSRDHVRGPGVGAAECARRRIPIVIHAGSLRRQGRICERRIRRHDQRGNDRRPRDLRDHLR